MKMWSSPVPAVLLCLDSELDDPLLDLGKERKVKPTLLPPQQKQLEALKSRYKYVIQDNPDRTNLVEHSIPTRNTLPIRLSPYCLAHKSHEYQRGEIKSLLELGIIEPSTNQWAAPIILVPKKEGSSRMCVDYRKLNAVTQSEPYPLLRIE